MTKQISRPGTSPVARLIPPHASPNHRDRPYAAPSCSEQFLHSSSPWNHCCHQLPCTLPSPVLDHPRLEQTRSGFLASLATSASLRLALPQPVASESSLSPSV